MLIGKGINISQSFWKSLPTSKTPDDIPKPNLDIIALNINLALFQITCVCAVLHWFVSVPEKCWFGLFFNIYCLPTGDQPIINPYVDVYKYSIYLYKLIKIWKSGDSEIWMQTILSMVLYVFWLVPKTDLQVSPNNCIRYASLYC